jgi:uncharacterized protein with ParB-like and HNH nuclease domain
MSNKAYVEIEDKEQDIIEFLASKLHKSLDVAKSRREDFNEEIDKLVVKYKITEKHEFDEDLLKFFLDSEEGDQEDEGRETPE